MIKDNRIIKINKTAVLVLLLIPLVVLLIMYGYGLQGNDFWWHQKVGEWICVNKALPSQDMFSWYGVANNLTWYSQEWLSDVIFYLIFHNFGEIGFFIFCICTALLFLTFIIVSNYKYIKNRIVVSAIFISMMAVCFSMFMYGRPHLFSGILLYFELKCLYAFYRNNNTKLIWFVPLIAVLWSNLHGGSSNLAYILCLIFLVVPIKSFNCSKIKNNSKKKNYYIILSAVTMLTIFAIFVNPQGTYVFTYPYINIGNSYMLTVVQEWSSPNIKDIGCLVIYFIPFAAALLSMVFGKRKILLIDFCILCFFFYLFMRSMRFAFLLYIALSAFIYKYFPKIKIHTNVVYSLICIALIFTLSVYAVLNTVNVVSHSDNIIKKTLNQEYCDMVKNDDVQRLYNDYNYGGELIANDVKVFVDERYDLYADNIIEDAFNFVFLCNTKDGGKQVLPDEIIDKYEFDAILIETNRPLRAYLDSHKDKYEKIMSDNQTSYYHVVKYYKN